MPGTQVPLRILIVEDDQDFRDSLCEMLQRAGHAVEAVADGRTAEARLTTSADLLLTDLQLPDSDGLDLIPTAMARWPGLQTIVMTGYGDIPSAVEAMRRGARAYLTKPFELEELFLHLREIAEVVRLRQAAARTGRGALVGTSAAMQRVYRAIDTAAAATAPVIIEGETGTGKELVAQAVHDLSLRSSSPLIAVNIAALPGDLVESELFGHERGAFTGAVKRQRGRFLLAKGGSLFLGELEALPPQVQPKLLRVLETGEIWAIGAERLERAEVRVIAAANVDLHEMVRAGSFREDLFYRLAVLRIRVPPLREHPEDIPVIATTLLDRIPRQPQHLADPVEFTPQALAAMFTHRWPGNVRELRNVLERVLAGGSVWRRVPPHITADDLELETEQLPVLPFKQARARAADDWSRRTIRAALLATDGNVSDAARILQMNTSALFRLIKRFGLRSWRPGRKVV